MGIFTAKKPLPSVQITPIGKRVKHVSRSTKLNTGRLINYLQTKNRNPAQAAKHAYGTLTKQGVKARTPAQVMAKKQKAKSIAFRQQLQAKRATTRSIARTKQRLASQVQKQRQEAAVKKAAKIGFAAKTGLGLYQNLVHKPLANMATAGRWR